MKKLNATAVGLMMTSLIAANGKTTNLDIKNALRAIGYQASQDEVKQFVNEILVQEQENPTEAIFEVSFGSYREYTFTDFAFQNGYSVADSVNIDVITGAVVNDEEIEEEIEEKEEEEEENDDNEIETVIETVNLTIGVSCIPNAVIAVTKTVTSDDVREPEMIYQTENLASQHNDGTKWVVFHKDRTLEFHIYNESLNSDKVRSRYASMLKLPMQDVRAKRIKNFIKD